MQNRDTAAALNYHESTKLAYINLANKPPLYKSYSGLPTVPLAEHIPSPEMPTLDALATYNTPVGADFGAGGATPTLETVTQLLYYCAGVIRTGHFRLAGEVHFRAAASAGGLYPVDTYLVCGELEGLAAGVYHFGPDTFRLTRLRQGDYRAFLAAAAGGDDHIRSAPLTIIFTTVFWRSSWKYRTRGYRYCFWDNGTVAANLLATAAAANLPARVVNAFMDHQVNQLLGIDGEGETTTCLAPVGASHEAGAAAGPTGELPPVEGDSTITAPGEIDYPDIREVHAATLLADTAEVAQAQGAMGNSTPVPEAPFFPFPSSGEAGVPSMPLGQTIRERGSTRRFDHLAMPFDHLAAMLTSATRGTPADFLSGPLDSLMDVYLIANAVDGLPSGAYYFSPHDHGLYQLKEGDFRQEAGHLGFEQALPHDASAVVFMLADLDRILAHYGNRGYRAAQLEAGIIGGKLYLGAHSLGLGASGLTFYDDEVSEFFSPHSAGKSAMFVVPLGVTAQVNRVRPFRSRIAMSLDAQSRGGRRR